jgi:hypothetical protein
MSCLSGLSAKQHIPKKKLKGLRIKNKLKQLYLILEAFPAVTVPPFSLKLGRSFFSFAGSN